MNLTEAVREEREVEETMNSIFDLAGTSGDLAHVLRLLKRLEAEFGRVRPGLEAEIGRIQG